MIRTPNSSEHSISGWNGGCFSRQLPHNVTFWRFVLQFRTRFENRSVGRKCKFIFSFEVVSILKYIQGRVFGGSVFGDHTVGTSVVVVIGISKTESYDKIEDRHTGQKEVKVSYLE